LLNLEIKTGQIVSQFLYYDLNHKMTKFEILFFMKVVDMDVTFQMKLTLLKLEWQNTKYGRQPEDR
jgi:hypothetical protein